MNNSPAQIQKTSKSHLLLITIIWSISTILIVMAITDLGRQAIFQRGIVMFLPSLLASTYRHF